MLIHTQLLGLRGQVSIMLMRPLELDEFTFTRHTREIAEMKYGVLQNTN
jgi:hypothetical protein